MPLLTPAEEIELAHHVQKMKGLLDIPKDEITPRQRHQIRMGKRARDRMMAANLRLVVSVAKKYQNQGLELLDLVQEGAIGLERAVDKFDPAMGYKFSTYACWWIRQAVTRHISMHRNSVRIPSHAVSISKNILVMVAEYEEEFGTTPTIDEVCESLGVSKKMAKASLDSIKLRHIQSLDKQINFSDGSSKTLGDIIPDDQSQSVDELLDQEEIRNCVIASFKSLTKREEQVIRMRFGIVDNLDTTHIHEIGDKYDNA